MKVCCMVAENTNQLDFYLWENKTDKQNQTRQKKNKKIFNENKK